MRSESKKKQHRLQQAMCSDGICRSPDEFLDKYTLDYKLIGEFPSCILGCQLTIAGIGTKKVEKHYRHHPGSDCPYAKNTRFTRSLKDVKWNPESGKKLLREFCTDRNLAETYRVLTSLFRLRYLHRDEFNRLCRTANERRIWCFSGIDMQSIPYVMASLRVVHCYEPEAEKQNPTADQIRYSMQAILKLGKTGIRSVWESPGSCYLKISFVNEDRPNKELSHSPVSVPDRDIETSRMLIGNMLNDEDFIEGIGKFCCEKDLFHRS